MSVVKTRQQTEMKLPNAGLMQDVRNILRAEGFKGLYRGFGTVTIAVYVCVFCFWFVITGSRIPNQILYITTLEAVKECVASTKFSPFRHFLAGLSASIISNVLTVPMDVISQRQMVNRGERTVLTSKFINLTMLEWF